MVEENKFGPKPLARRPTIKDVAREAKVSPMTVSNVLNNRLQFVSSKTKLRVEREIARLNYRRQSAARNLRGSHQRSVGMIVIDDSPAFLIDFFTAQVVAGLANVLNSADYTMTVQGVRAKDLPNSMIMRSFEVGGFCAMISGDCRDRKMVVEQLRTLDQPLVLFQQEASDKYEDVCTVRQDDRAGGRLIGDHLLARGVKNILVLRPGQNWPAIEERIQGLQESIAQSGSKVELNIVKAGNESYSDVKDSFGDYLDSNTLPAAIFCGNDQIALAAMLLLADRGYSVPEDVRIVGFNGFEAHRYLRPQLTTVLSSAYELGERAGEAMLARLSSGQFPARDIVLPVHFNIGATT